MLLNCVVWLQESIRFIVSEWFKLSNPWHKESCCLQALDVVHSQVRVGWGCWCIPSYVDFHSQTFLLTIKWNWTIFPVYRQIFFHLKPLLWNLSQNLRNVTDDIPVGVAAHNKSYVGNGRCMFSEYNLSSWMTAATICDIICLEINLKIVDVLWRFVELWNLLRVIS